ncbi:hypothetical protein ASPBRDRAFT_251915 [Aspergillus brasiliensis CBS 101740]|uniref:F-box domain-containing protein n=1 Tax=Aspergillus brasiliensis (strain CBS 101740 / IMI 381727 / IBT 21946) TaxID=767769 RepID=A0A1L9V1U2_ASPBC|nr:hypothetical protein ASPBRDRAFT_251915 [Aspergillus brasiliensis CBS 101740]
MLDKLPTEVLCIVLEYLDRQGLNNLCRVSKDLYAITVPLLYESVTLTSGKFEMGKIWSHAGALLQAPISPVDLLVYVRDIEIREHDNYPRHQCFHIVRARGSSSESDYYQSSNDEKVPYSRDEIGSEGIRYLTSALLNAFARFAPDKLQRFCWNVGTCVPIEILGRSGFLVQNQRKLEAICLRTGHTCDIGDDQISLSEFTSLKSISWSGLDHASHMAELCLSLKLNARHLESLDLGARETCLYRRPEDSIQDMFARWILGMCEHSTKSVFPVLKHLALFKMDLSAIFHCFPSIFNPSVLQTLKLRHCKRWGKALQAIQESGTKNIALKTLLIQSGLDGHDAYSSLIELPSFIGSFEGLEGLFLSNLSPIEPISTWCSVVAHKKTLKQLLCEHFHSNGYADSPRRLYLSASQNPLAELNLEFLGICCYDPNILISLLSAPLLKKTIRVLHLRVIPRQYVISGDLESRATTTTTNNKRPPPPKRGSSEFLEWAFGPSGPPYLTAVVSMDPLSPNPRSDRFHVRDEHKKHRWLSLHRDRAKRYNFFRQYGDALDACRSG